jgi:hypothetical protein
MMNFLRKHKVKIFLLTICGFLAGTFVGFGSYLFGERTYYDTAAVVNGQKIPYKIYYSLYNNSVSIIRNSDMDLTEELMKRIQNEIITSLVKDELIYQQADKYGIIVSDSELAADIQKYPYFLNENKQFDSRYYFQFLNNMRLSPKEFENLRRKQLISNKLQLLIASSAKMSDAQEKFLKENSKEEIDEAMLLQIKPNEILNDWFEKVQDKSDYKITLKNM